MSPLSQQDRGVIVQTSPSPSTYNTERQRRRLEKDGFVEQHVADFALHRLTKAREEATLMEAILEQGGRKLKGKIPEHRIDQSTYDSSEGSMKRKSEENVKKSHKRQKTSEEEFGYESCTSDKAAGDKEVTSATVGNDAPSQGC